MNKTVFISGRFNIIHPGHIRLFSYAKSLGGKLIVAIEGDSIAKENSYINENLRLESVKSNTFVDECFIYNKKINEVILKLKPDIVVKGKEHQFRNNPEISAIDKYGGKLIFSSGTSSYSSFELLNMEKEINNTITKPIEFLERHKINQQKLENIISKFKDLKIAIFGDIIVDEYISCDALGMSREEPVIVLKPNEKLKYLGGAGIVASHASSLGSKVFLFSVIGKDSNSNFVIDEIRKNNLNNNVIKDQSRVTTFKQRFRSDHKTMFKVSELINDAISIDLQNKIVKEFTNIVKEIDIIVFSDFNYGMLPQNLVDQIIRLAKENKIFVAADSQSSSQIGDISRFKNSDLLTPTEYEARVSSKNQDDGLVTLSELVRKKTKAKHVLLKLGKEGLLINSFHKNKDDIITDRIESLNKSPVDYAGAGDSMLIVSSMSQKISNNIWISSYLGSLAAALQISRVGNIPLKIDELTNNI